jgi:hypothetical protein
VALISFLPSLPASHQRGQKEQEESAPKLSGSAHLYSRGQKWSPGTTDLKSVLKFQKNIPEDACSSKRSVFSTVYLKHF